jgi:hypothetical protein
MNEAEYLWDSALSRLDSDAQDYLKQPNTSAKESVVALIKEMDEKKKARETKQEGWTIRLPRIGNKKPRVINVRSVVYGVMEAAFEFNEIVTQVLTFDPTKYGMDRSHHPLILPGGKQSLRFLHRCARMVGCFVWDECEFRLAVRSLRGGTTDSVHLILTRWH